MGASSAVRPGSDSNTACRSGHLSRSARRLDGMRTSLKGIRDMERLATQLAYQRSNARDLVATAHALNACRLSLSGVETVKTRSSHI